MISDIKLQKDVMEALAFDPSIGGSEHIGVAALDGIVELSGSVPSYAEKINAEKCAEHVSGVKTIVSKLKVDLPEAHAMPDQELAAAVSNALSWNNHVPRNGARIYRARHCDPAREMCLAVSERGGS